MSFFFRYILLSLFVLHGAASHAQTENYTLTGKVIMKNGDSYKYELVINSRNGAVAGYSRTWWNGSGKPNKASISGNIDAKARTLFFKEIRVMVDPPLQPAKNELMCLFEGMLTYREVNNKLIFSGPLSGTDDNGNHCTDGTILLGCIANKSLSGNKVATRPAETVELPANALIWHSDSLIINIWDYGTVDGDVATVLLNGKAVLANYTITSSKVRLHFPLKDGLNTLEIKAANPQSVLPVSARVILADGDKTHEFAAANAHGKDAINIMKKK